MVFKLLELLEAVFANISVVSLGIRVLRGKLQVAEKQIGYFWLLEVAVCV